MGAGWELNSDGNHTPMSALTEKVFHLSVLLWTQSSEGGGEGLHRLPLIYFSAVLGIQSSTLAYRTAHLYTPILAGLVWVGRLFMLEYALPQQAYTALG